MSDIGREAPLNGRSARTFRKKMKNRPLPPPPRQRGRGLGSGTHVLGSTRAERSMITVECHSGVLIELRFDGAPTLDDVERFKTETAALVTRLSAEHGRRVTLCTDLRRTELFAPEVASRIIDLMRGDNPRVDRNGVLGSESALLTLQVQRLLIEAGSPGRRRIFTNPGTLIAWLDDALIEDERSRLRSFLGGELSPFAPR